MTQTSTLRWAVSAERARDQPREGMTWPDAQTHQDGWRLDSIDALALSAVAECAESVIDALDAPTVVSFALEEGLSAIGAPEGRTAVRMTSTGSADQHDCGGRDSRPDGACGATRGPEVVSLDEYARAVLYNGIGHYEAARRAAIRACADDDFELLDGALAELVEACVRSGSRDVAATALARLEERTAARPTAWARGIRACARALTSDHPEPAYVEAIDLLSQAEARVSIGRARLLYGEWLRRQGRRVDARQQLTVANEILRDVGLNGFADRAQRELLATCCTVRKRTDDTRLTLTEREIQIARLAAARCTNPEIGERLFLSSRTVEWHLRKIFSKLGISSRRELDAVVRPTLDALP